MTANSAKTADSIKMPFGCLVGWVPQKTMYYRWESRPPREGVILFGDGRRSVTYRENAGDAAFPKSLWDFLLFGSKVRNNNRMRIPMAYVVFDVGARST